MSQQAKCNRVLPNLRCREIAIEIRRSGRAVPCRRQGGRASPDSHSLTLPFPYSGVQSKEACNKDDNYHDADDVENVHCVLRLGYARFQCEFAALE